MKIANKWSSQLYKMILPRLVPHISLIFGKYKIMYFFPQSLLRSISCRSDRSTNITLSTFGTVHIIKSFISEKEDRYTVPKHTCMALSLSRLLTKKTPHCYEMGYNAANNIGVLEVFNRRYRAYNLPTAGPFLETD